MNFIVIGYYTKGSKYKDEAEGLIKSCANFNIPCVVRGYNPRANWHENTSMKPEVILDMMYEFPDKDIVYIDADGVVQQYPELFETITEDLAVHYLKDKELLSGTIFIRNNPKMQLFIKCWINVQGNNPTLTDQQSLDLTIRKYARGQKVSLYRLPPTYTQIYDTMRDAGKPVIEHFQASRRFKQSVSCNKLIPKTVLGMKTREAGDGSFYLPRGSRKVIDFLKDKFEKFPNELRWFPKQSMGDDLEKLRPYFRGKEVYIVGKGPSLDNVSKADFKDPKAPIICINESIHKIESLGLPNKLHAMQQDAWLKDTCKPRFGAILISWSCRYWYPDVTEKYVFRYQDLNLTTNNITVIYAIALAKKLGSTALNLVSFDACVDDKSLEYGKCIGYDAARGGSKKRFLSHKRVILQFADPLRLQFITPKPLASQVADKLQQSLHSQTKHHERVQSSRSTYLQATLDLPC